MRNYRLFHAFSSLFSLLTCVRQIEATSLLLLLSVGGKGEDLGFAGMVLFFRSLITVPALAIANGLLMQRNWKSKDAVVLVGFIFPGILAVYEYFSLYGHL